ncbi:MAG: NAD+ synthase [Phycisphaerae bacterium]|nr:NAD+ synthase [Phycisphaerae bacterium]
MKIAVAQIDTTVGDIDGNVRKMIAGVEKAKQAGAALVVFPELAAFGYPPKDLVLRRGLVEKNVQGVRQVAAATHGITAILGFVQPGPNGEGKGIRNAAALCADGQIVATYAKMLLPTYDVFDEARYFDTGDRPVVVPVKTPSGATVAVGLTICEDLWNDQQYEGRKVYGLDPIEMTRRAGAQLLVNISGSPFRIGVQARRERLFSEQVREHALPLVYVNLVGGNDDLLFDGASLVLDAQGRVLDRAPAFVEDFRVVDLDHPQPQSACPYPEPVASVHRGLVLGIRDYVSKCGFREVVLGLSGGIDSAVTAALAVEALGADRVHGVALPSRYSSDHSLEDARRLSESLGIDYRVLPIEEAHQSLERTLAPLFAGRESDVTEENVQARLRGNLLMALSNKFNWLLLTTGNKSELAVGYCTLYGDMCGGLAVISDVPKTMVYKLAEEMNRAAGRDLIPRRTITKPPSAELKADQTDQDTLPPYDVLDTVLERLVEREESLDEIVAAGFDRQLVERIGRMVDRNEYKRKQSAVGLKVTSRAFGTGRRMPIAAKGY